MASEQTTAPEGPETPEQIKLVVWFWHHVKSNWEGITRPPVIIIIVIIAFSAWQLGKLGNEERVAIANDRVTFLNDQLIAYRDRLNGASPDQAAKQIADLAATLRDEIHQVESLKKRQEEAESNNKEISRRLDALSPYTLTSGQIDGLANAVSNIGPVTITLITDAACGDCQDVTEKLNLALTKAANVRIRKATFIGAGRTAPTGIGFIPSTSISKERTKELAEVLRSAGVDFDEFPATAVFESDLELQINRRIKR